MDWDSLRVFLAVARTGQFLAAARHLKVDHATVGRRITALERALNARLLERRTTGVSLTAAGLKLFASAERVESELLQVSAELTDTDVELSGTVRIGAPDGLSTYYLARCFREFTRRHPAITIQLVPMPQAIPLTKREVDIVIVLEKPEAGRFVTRKLTDYSLGIYGVGAYLDEFGVPASAEALTRHRLIGYVEDYAYSSALDYVRDLYANAKTSFESASAVGQLEAIRAGVGLGVAHDYIARQFPEMRRVLPERQARRSYWIVVHEDMRDLGRIKAVHAHLVESIGQDRAMFVRGLDDDGVNQTGCRTPAPH